MKKRLVPCLVVSCLLYIVPAAALTADASNTLNMTVRDFRKDGRIFEGVTGARAGPARPARRRGALHRYGEVRVFINRRLVIDPGGVHTVQTASISLNDLEGTLKLGVGTTCSLDFFYVQRHTASSQLTIKTTMALTSP